MGNTELVEDKWRWYHIIMNNFRGQLTGAQKDALYVLVSILRKEGGAFHWYGHVPTLGEYAKVCQRTCRELFSNLVGLGLLSNQGKSNGRNANDYYLRIPDRFAKSAIKTSLSPAPVLHQRAEQGGTDMPGKAPHTLYKHSYILLSSSKETPAQSAHSEPAINPSVAAASKSLEELGINGKGTITALIGRFGKDAQAVVQYTLWLARTKRKPKPDKLAGYVRAMLAGWSDKDVAIARKWNVNEAAKKTAHAEKARIGSAELAKFHSEKADDPKRLAAVQSRWTAMTPDVRRELHENVMDYLRDVQKLDHFIVKGLRKNFDPNQPNWAVQESLWQLIQDEKAAKRVRTA